MYAPYRTSAAPSSFGISAPPKVSAKGNELRPGNILGRGDGLVTKNGGVALLQNEGNFVLYHPDGKALWWSHAHATPAVKAQMLKNGVLVLIGPKGEWIWESHTPTPNDATRIVFQDDGNLVWYDASNRAVHNSRTDGWKMHPDLAPKSSNPFTDFLEIITAPITAPVKAVAKVTEKIPVLGDITRIVSNTASAPANLAMSIASGARLDQAVLGHFKEQLKNVKEIAPYAQMVVSFVPGIGTGVAAAIGAGVALAEGRGITEAVKAGLRGAIPGGPLAVAAFDTALSIAGGKDVGKAVLEAARNQLPAAAQKAFDIGLAVVTGENIQNALANGLASLAPDALKKVIEQGKSAVSKIPGLSQAIKGVAAGKPQEGFQLAAGLLQQAGINEKAIIAARSKLPLDALQGFDAALRTQEQNLAWLQDVAKLPPGPAGPAVAAAAGLPANHPARKAADAVARSVAAAAEAQKPKAPAMRAAPKPAEKAPVTAAPVMRAAPKAKVATNAVRPAVGPATTPMIAYPPYPQS